MDNSFDSLKAVQFQKDPRVNEAKQLLLQALTDHQKSIVSVEPPHKDLIVSYQEILNAFANYRGAKLYFPYIGSGFGKGALVELLDGSIKYDLISGIGPHYWGHNHPDLLVAGIDASLSDTVMQGHLQQNVDTIYLSSTLCKASGMDHCFLSSSGAMANENALKIALQKKYPAPRILAFEKCFMGRTLALSQITDKPGFREGLPSTIAIDYIPFYQPHQPEESTQRTLTVLKKHLMRYPKQHAVMCFELVQGEGGFHTGTTEFFKSLMTVLKEHNIAIFVDEIQTFGRTPALFAYQYFGLEEYVDIVSIGKLAQVCATLFKADFKPRPGLLSQTFTSSTSAIKASQLILKKLIEGDFFGPEGKIAKIHAHFVSHFESLRQHYPESIQGPYGLGAMIAFTPFKGESQKVTQFVQELFQAGIISFVAGDSPTRIRFLPPIEALTFEDIDTIREILEEALKK